MNEVKMCVGKGFGWICAINRWPVQERAQISFCPITLQVLIFGKRTVQADSSLHSEQIDTLFVSVGGHFGPEAQTLHVTVRNCFFCLLKAH